MKPWQTRPKSRRLVLASSLALAMAAVPFAGPSGGGGQEQPVSRGTPAAPRAGGIASLSHASEHEEGWRVLGSVHVGPPTVLLERVEPFAEGETVVPIAYSFLFLEDSEWRTTSDGLYFRRAAEAELLGFATSIGSAGSSNEGDGPRLADVAIQPRDGLSWGEVDSKLDITVGVDLVRRR